MLVSIVVPIYNSEEYLDHCIESIIAQSYTQFELLLLDDGSTDRSLDICKKWEMADQRIIVCSKENSGVSATRNLGIRKSTGDYILFVDSDDYLSKDYLLNMMKVITTMGEDVWPVSGYDFVGGEPFYIIEKNHKSEMQEISQGIMEVFNNHLLNVPFNKLYHKKTLLEYDIKFREEISLGEDLFFNIDYLKTCKIKGVVILDNNIYFYRVGNVNSLSNKYDDRYFEHQLELFKALYELFIILGVNNIEISNFAKEYGGFISGCPRYYWEKAPKHKLSKANEILRKKEYKEYINNHKKNMHWIAWAIYRSGNYLLVTWLESIYQILNRADRKG